MRRILILTVFCLTPFWSNSQDFGTYWALYATEAYQDPDTSSVVVRELNVGEPSIVVGQESSFLITDRKEYLPIWAMTRNPPAVARKDYPKKCLVLTEQAQVRNRPGIRGELLYFLDKGDSIIVVRELEQFYQLEDANYVRKSDVEENPEFRGYGELVSEHHSGGYHSYTFRKVNTWTTITEYQDQRSISIYRSRN